LFVNLAAIYIFGKEVESIFGTFRYLLIYLIASWGAGLLSFILSKGISIGASGAIFGIIGALVIFFYRQQEKISGARLRFKSMYTLVIINLLFGFMIPRIDNAGHIGGLISGVIASWFIAPEYKIQKDDILQKLIITRKPDSIRLISGLLIVSCILFLLTIKATGKQLFLLKLF
jgi:rhomboid protease GluP